MDTLFSLKNKVAIVTGTSRGLGQYFARALAKAGADLVITSRSLESLNEFKREIEDLGRKVLPVKLDVHDHQSIKDMVKRVMSEYGKIDILVNNAGCNVRKLSTDISWEDWDAVLDTNLKGSFFCCTEVVKHMLPRRYGKIINIGSATCVFGYAGLAPYGASRGGVLQMSKSLAHEYGKFGINVNILAPGWFKTAQNTVLYENKEWVDYIVERIPLGKPGQPNDLDGTIIFLASDASQYITGQLILVDGGFTTGCAKAIINTPAQSR